MDTYIRNIKSFICTDSTPHTAHKTMEAPCTKHGQALYRADKPPPDQCNASCGLLNVYLIAVEFARNCKIGRLYQFIGITTSNLSIWQCYIAKYP